MNAVGDIAPVASWAAFCWLTVVCFAEKSASNQSTLCFRDPTRSWTVLVSGSRSAGVLVTLKPETTPPFASARSP
jgi:hypothetical protein